MSFFIPKDMLCCLRYISWLLNYNLNFFFGTSNLISLCQQSPPWCTVTSLIIYFICRKMHCDIFVTIELQLWEPKSVFFAWLERQVLSCLKGDSEPCIIHFNCKGNMTCYVSMGHIRVKGFWTFTLVDKISI